MYVFQADFDFFFFCKESCIMRLLDTFEKTELR